MKISFSILLLFFFQNIFPQNKSLLKGNIGKQQIVMILEFDDVSASANYYNINSKIDHYLVSSATLKGKKIRLQKSQWSSKIENYEMIEEMTLQPTIKNGWSGFWKGKNKIKLPIFLKKIDVTANTFKNIEYVYGDFIDKVYDSLRLQNLRFKKDSTTVKNKLILDWYSEPISKIYSFRIKSGIGDSTKLKKINAILKKHQLNNIIDFFDCPRYSLRSTNYDHWINDVIVTTNFISVETHIYCDCGGTHPNSFDDNLIINLKTAEEIKNYDEIFWLVGKPVLNDFGSKNSNYSDEYFKYSDTLGKKIVEILTNLYPKEMNISLGENQCDYSRPDNWSFASFSFREKGLYLNPSFPHASQCCNYPEFSIIPYKVILEYLNKASELEF